MRRCALGPGGALTPEYGARRRPDRFSESAIAGVCSHGPSWTRSLNNGTIPRPFDAVVNSRLKSTRTIGYGEADRDAVDECSGGDSQPMR